MSIVKKILGERLGPKDYDDRSMPMPKAKGRKLPRFSVQDYMQFIPDDPEQEARFDALAVELVEPLYEVIESSDLHEGGVMLTNLVDLVTEGKVYAVTDAEEDDFFGYLTVPLEQWKAAIEELKNRLASGE